ncbi:TonB-dependent receptor plug domain-containing protein [Sphingobium yanoikuyae]|uniref:TonB-dependent receptor plug domain-containing protein n=1 Tax=Sphingobium yanoikuyae TaxID=13690 RepID=UPI0022DD9B14|nr:TonB-dependent receptor [Sphingobium yanoikuyae]WBQ15721.1 TonB-dependent receptor [Sphingobium yanoikuyae]
MRSHLSFCRLLASASLLGLAGTAMAQEDAPTAPAQDNAAKDVSSADIVVTGSRIIRNGSASPTPLTTVSTEALSAAAPAGTISDALNNLPVFSGSRNQFSNPGSNATGVQGGNGAANVLNLRNLGSYRTLVLFDGHRIPPTLYNSTVDVDLIPQELISRVDVVTGGVSAVYGSDAVSGVVNYVLNRNFDGFRAHAEAGISQRGDAATRDIGGAFGFKVGERGHFEASVQHREYDGILNRAFDRSWDNLAAMQGAGTTANPYYLATDVRLATYTFGGYISNGAQRGKRFDDNGNIVPFVAGTASGSSCCQIGGDGAYQNSSMSSPSRGTQAFARFDYELTDYIHVYAQGAANIKKNTSYTGWNQLTGLTFSSSNAFLSPAAQAALAGAGTFTMNEIWSGAPRIEASSKTNQYYGNVGIEGSLADFKWNATYTHGYSRLQTTVDNMPNNQKLAAALDAVVSPTTGQIVCQASLTNPSAYGDCVPLNLFGASSSSSAALDYVLGKAVFITHTIQDSADVSISGPLFDTWAGPVNVALSGEWRKQRFNAASSVLPTDLADCTGLRYNCTSATVLYPTTFPNSDTVSQSVKEAAIEVEVPLLKDVAFAKSLTLNGAARYTDYSTSGHYTTWKVGGVWEVNDQIKLRGTASRDIRAPTLYDLYQPVTTVYGNYTDTTKTPNVTAYLPSINMGNPNLTAEVGKTYTAGIVLKPDFVPGLTLTADYYHTVVSNAISVIQGFNAAVQKGCVDSGGSSIYCSLIQRDAAGNATAYYIQPYNIAKVKTWGIDGEADYATHIGDHPLNLRLMVNYQPHIYYEQPGIPTIDQGGAGWGLNGLMPSPSVTLAGFINFKPSDTVSIDLFERYRNKFRRSGVASHVFAEGQEYVKDFATTNLTVTLNTGAGWKMADSALYFSVTNLFDAKPPLSGYYSGTTSAGASYEFSDDPTGRAFMIGFRIKG